jgi:hypothetical protein
VTNYARLSGLTVHAEVNGRALCWYAGCLMVLRRKGARRKMWERFRKTSFHVLLALAFLASTVQAADPINPLETPTDRVAVSGGSADTIMDTIFKIVSEIAQNPIENTIGTIAFSFLAWRVGMLIKSATGIPAARKKSGDLLGGIRKSQLEYENERAIYLGYEARLAELVARSEELKKQLSGPKSFGNLSEEEPIREELDAVDGQIEEIKKKIPMVQATEALRSLVLAEAAIQKTLSKFEKMMESTASNPIKNNNPKLQRWASEGLIASKLTREHYRPDYLGEWLATEAGRSFLRSEKGQKWKRELDDRKKASAQAVHHLIEVHNRPATAYNASLTDGESPVELIAHSETEHGSHTKRFFRVPKNPLEEADSVDRESIPDLVKEICEKNLGRLSKNTDSLKLDQSKVYSDLKGNLRWVVGTGIVYGVFDRVFYYRHKVTFLNARARSKQNDKIAENRRIDIAGQLDEEKKGLKRLAPFTTDVTEAILAQETKIAERLKARFNFRSETLGKKRALEERTAIALSDRDAEIARIKASFDEAMKKVLKTSTWTTVDTVIANLYTDDQAKRDTTVKRTITLILRETIANLYPDIADEAALDQIEMTIIPGIVNDLNEKLKKFVEENRKTTALFPDSMGHTLAVSSVPVPVTGNAPASAGSLAASSGLLQAP